MDEATVVDGRPLYEKLKPGPGLPAEMVFEDQRRRLHGALIALVDQVGWERIQVRTLVRMAGVSTAAFYKHFVNVEDCLASTYDGVIENLLGCASIVRRRQLNRHDALRATVTALMEKLAAEPRAAHLVLVDIFAADRQARARIGHAVGELEKLVSASFSEETASGSIVPPRRLITGMTAGMLRVARTTTLDGRAAELPGLVNQLADWMLTLPSLEMISLLTASDGSPPATPSRQHLSFPDDERRVWDSGDVNERDRLLRAALKLTAKGGLAELTVTKLCAQAGVSRRRFNAMFGGGVDECFLESLEMAGQEAVATAGEWSKTASGWERQICRFVLALCAQAARNRGQARLAFLGSLAVGRTGLLFRERVIGRLALALREAVPTDHRLSMIEAEASVAATWHIVQTDIVARRARGLPLSASLLSYVLLTPAVGPKTAALVVQAEIGAREF